MKHIELWHGGRELEYHYREFGGTKKKRWEYGPGLYLTTHYERARTYAKGGGSTYQICLEEGNELKNIMVDITELNEFVMTHCIKHKQANVLKYLHRNLEYSQEAPKVHLEILLNLIINDEAMQNSKTHLLNQFLVDKGADYSVVHRYGGRDETVIVVFNRNKIKQVRAVKAADVQLNDFEKPFLFVQATTKPKIY